MQSRERVVKTLNHEIPDRVPIYEVYIDKRTVDFFIGIKQKSSWDLSVDETVFLSKKIGLDAVMHPLNWKPRNIMKNKKVDVSCLEYPREMVERVLGKCRLLVGKAHEEGLAAILYTHGCFDIPYEVLGFENYMLLLYDDYKYIEDVTEFFYRFYKGIILEFIKLRPDAIMIGDDIAYNSGLMIKPDVFLDLWYEREKDLVKTIKDEGIPVEYHTDGNLGSVLQYLIDIGVDFVNPVDTGSNDIFEIKKKYGELIGLRGNIDLSGSLCFGSPEEVYIEAKDKISKLKNGGNYICSSSHSITGSVKPENYLQIIKALNDFGEY
jgi:uroporphyrinogen decarboxylase